jgi:hypothetical protein
MEKVERRGIEKGGRGGELVKTTNEMPVMSRTPKPSPPQSMTYMEAKLPAIQAEQVEDDVAPVAAEYVPAKPSDEEYAYVDSNTSV